MKTAILGVGRMGRRHIQMVLGLDVELVGVFDLNLESLKLARDEHSLNQRQLFDNVDNLFSEVSPECVIIATTADSHCMLTCMAAERGAKYILVEKPMAVSLEQCDRMIEVCRRLGANLAVNHQMRFMEMYAEPKRMFGTAAYGGMSSMTVVGGNVGFAMNATHYFEAFRFLVDEDPVEVAAWFSPEVVPNPRGAQFKDRAGSVRAITKSGKRLYLEIGADQGHGITHIYGCRNGMITFNELSGELHSTEREVAYRMLPTTRYGMPDINSHRMIAPCEIIHTSGEVLKALLSNKNSVSGEDGRRVIELLVAAHHSAENGSVSVGLATQLDRSRVFPWA